jgi:hypothetical protein
MLMREVFRRWSYLSGVADSTADMSELHVLEVERTLQEHRP